MSSKITNRDILAHASFVINSIREVVKDRAGGKTGWQITPDRYAALCELIDGPLTQGQALALVILEAEGQDPKPYTKTKIDQEGDTLTILWNLLEARLTAQQVYTEVTAPGNQTLAWTRYGGKYRLCTHLYSDEWHPVGDARLATRIALVQYVPDFIAAFTETKQRFHRDLRDAVLQLNRITNQLDNEGRFPQ